MWSRCLPWAEHSPDSTAQPHRPLPADAVCAHAGVLQAVRSKCPSAWLAWTQKLAFVTCERQKVVGSKSQNVKATCLHAIGGDW